MRNIADDHTIPAPSYRCNKCNLSKERTAFFTDYRYKSGLQSWCKACHREYHKNHEKGYKKNHPEKYRARAIIQARVHRGTLIRPEKCPICEDRGVTIHAHHQDYSKPLDVTWCCQSCHRKLHQK